MQHVHRQEAAWWMVCSHHIITSIDIDRGASVSQRGRALCGVQRRCDGRGRGGVQL
jgi:hypothetical protein